MTAQQEEPTGESGSLLAEAVTPKTSDSLSESMPATAAAAWSGSGDAAPALASPAAAPPKLDGARAAAAKLEASHEDAFGVASKVINMSSGNRAWEAQRAGRDPRFGTGPVKSRKRRLSTLVAVAAVAALAGAFGSLLAISGLSWPGHDVASDRDHALEESVARVDADILALTASFETTSRQSLAQLARTGDRLEKLEKAQADPTSKLGRLSEGLELLRDAPPSIAAAPVEATRMVSKEVTGSITPLAGAAVPRAEIGRLPTVDGWLLRKITRGVALIEDRGGMYYEVHAGDPVPGLGRVNAIRRQDGRWVVVTNSGLIVGH